MLTVRNSCRVLTILCFSLIAQSIPSAYGQSCNAVRAVQGPFGYQHRLNSDRCEGLYQTPVSGESLELLSLVDGEINYDLGTDKSLVVTVPDVSAVAAIKVSVRARALPIGTYYRMDADVPSGQSIKWPLGDVIAPAGLRSGSIGVVGRVERGNDTIYVPVSVLPEGKSRVDPGPPIVLLRTGVDIEQVRWRVIADPGTATTPRWTALGDDTQYRVHAGDIIKLPLKQTLHSVNTLEVSAKTTDSGEWLNIRIPVFSP